MMRTIEPDELELLAAGLDSRRRRQQSGAFVGWTSTLAGDVPDDAYAHPEAVEGQIAEGNVFLIDDGERFRNGAGPNGAFRGHFVRALERFLPLHVLEDLVDFAGDLGDGGPDRVRDTLMRHVHDLA